MSRLTKTSAIPGLAERAFVMLIAVLLALMAYLTYRFGPELPGVVWLLGSLAGINASLAIAAPLRWLRFCMALDLFTQDMADR